MMRVSVLLFASYADAFGGPAVDLALRDGATAGDLLAELRAQSTGQSLPPAAIAVNQVYVAHTHPLVAGDEVAVIPPVAGG